MWTDLKNEESNVTQEEHAKIETTMRCAISRLIDKSRGNQISLDEKIAMKREVKQLSTELKNHCLNFFVLTTEEGSKAT
jgi:hypothetical protein